MEHRNTLESFNIPTPIFGTFYPSLGIRGTDVADASQQSQASKNPAGHLGDVFQVAPWNSSTHFDKMECLIHSVGKI